MFLFLANVTMRARPIGELYDNDGHTYLRLNKLETEPKIGDLRFYANGLVPDPALSKFL